MYICPGPRRDTVGANSKIKRLEGSRAGFRLSQFWTANQVFEILKKIVHKFRFVDDFRQKNSDFWNQIFENSPEYGNFENSVTPTPN